jgi:hypothetical protein
MGVEEALLSSRQCVSANCDVIFSLTELRLRRHCICFNSHIIYNNLIIYILASISCVTIAPKRFHSLLCHHVQINNVFLNFGYFENNFRASEFRNVILYSIGVLFVLRWLMMKGMGHRLYEMCSAGCKNKKISFLTAVKTHVQRSTLLDYESCWLRRE